MAEPFRVGQRTRTGPLPGDPTEIERLRSEIALLSTCSKIPILYVPTQWLEHTALPAPVSIFDPGPPPNDCLSMIDSRVCVEYCRIPLPIDSPWSGEFLTLHEKGVIEPHAAGI